MALAFVQSTTGNATGANTSLALTAFGSNTTTGNCIAVNASIATGGTQTSTDITTITDTQGNGYSRVDGGNATDGFGNFFDGELWIALNITGGASNVVTINHTTAGSISAVAQEFSGVATASATDKVKNANGNSSSPSSGASATTTNANDLVVGWVSGANSLDNFGLGSGYTNLGEVGNSGSSAGMESKIVSSTGAQTATFTSGNSDPWVCGVATFKAAAAVVSATYFPVRIPNKYVGPMAMRHNFHQPYMPNQQLAAAVGQTATSSTLLLMGVG